jgi:hypothetical protein
VHYVKQIRGIRPTKDIPFEEYYQNEIDSETAASQYRKYLIKTMLPLKPKNMTGEEWKIKKRRMDKEERERMKQAKEDQKLKWTVCIGLAWLLKSVRSVARSYSYQ